MIATLADMVPSFSFSDCLIFCCCCSYLPLKNLECKVLYLCWGGRLLSLKIHTDICSHFELGQCLPSFLLSSLLPPPLPGPRPLTPAQFKEKALFTLNRDAGDARVWDPSAQPTADTRVHVLCQIGWAVSLCLSVPPLHSSCGHLVGMWNPLETDAHALELVLEAPVPSIGVTPTVCTPAKKQWARGGGGHASACASFIHKLCHNPISS